jgi:hypothetical protein
MFVPFAKSVGIKASGEDPIAFGRVLKREFLAKPAIAAGDQNGRHWSSSCSPALLASASGAASYLVLEFSADENSCLLRVKGLRSLGL